MFQIRIVWSLFTHWSIVLQETQIATSGEKESAGLLKLEMIMAGDFLK
jgi:hypothetical protein